MCIRDSRQVVRPQLLQLLSHRYRPVAVGVGFHQTGKLTLGGQGPQGVIVGLQPIQMDLSPGSLLQIVHFDVNLLSLDLCHRKYR